MPYSLRSEQHKRLIVTAITNGQNPETHLQLSLPYTETESEQESDSYSHLYRDEIFVFTQEYNRLQSASQPKFYQMHLLAHAYSTLPAGSISLLPIAQGKLASATTQKDFAAVRIILNIHTILNPDDSIVVIFYKAICHFACQEWTQTNLLLTDFPNLSQRITVFKRDCSIAPESGFSKLLLKFEKYAKKWDRAQEQGIEPTEYPYDHSIYPLYSGPRQILDSHKKKHKLDRSIYPRY
jgi:hypothetical protein